jgi:hypothetical protein
MGQGLANYNLMPAVAGFTLGSAAILGLASGDAKGPQAHRIASNALTPMFEVASRSVGTWLSYAQLAGYQEPLIDQCVQWTCDDPASAGAQAAKVLLTVAAGAVVSFLLGAVHGHVENGTDLLAQAVNRAYSTISDHPLLQKVDTRGFRRSMQLLATGSFVAIAALKGGLAQANGIKASLDGFLGGSIMEFGSAYGTAIGTFLALLISTCRMRGMSLVRRDPIDSKNAMRPAVRARATAEAMAGNRVMLATGIGSLVTAPIFPGPDWMKATIRAGAEGFRARAMFGPIFKS